VCRSPGTDSAPYPIAKKLSTNGIPGIDNAPVCMAVYAKCSRRRARWTSSKPSPHCTARTYGLPPNEGTITLERAEVTVPEEIEGMVPFLAGQTLRWRMTA
jgi:dihydroorotase